MITRTKYIHTLYDLIGMTTMQYIAIVGEPAVDIQSFLMSLEASSIFEDLSILVLESDTLISKPQLLSKKKIDLLIISDGDSRNISEIRAIIDSQSFK